ncbi:NHLP leader peptide family natural product precursor [Microcystis wesenbergii FACHB-1317]|uniref:NHLP leader peptide family RiPP precursor n=1 Tax=Microcystis TaxID=1125 RepID=UPI000E36B0C5|nr:MULTISPECIES: NHLP leader peptide family RiPP precursor [Microcystis]MBD2287755.1 NHLP leader peptide family natural product precursor [Microcystis wesenbergii FACHB-1317]REJ58597.1 MAG: NHLP leader peptide family natural product precursor [Microcystis aeruginosa TA09]UZO78489.1 NHLP leader peptide family RiPP precursor [Microcystis aeruginosa str. Chao 1910]
MTGERNKLIWGEIVARAWRDAAFKQQLLSNPKAVLTEAGMSVPEGTQLQVVEDTPTLRHLVLPVAPADSSTLSEAELDLVSGGGSTTTPPPATVYGVEFLIAAVSVSVTEIQTTATAVTVIEN